MEPHKKWVKEIFDQAAPNYGEKSCCHFDYFGKKLVELSCLSEGDHVLDVATGKGAVLLAAHRQLGPKGKIIGVDLSQEMLGEQKKRNPNIDLLQMDAEHLDFPDHSFDVVFCAFALYYFPNLHATLSEFRRVLKPGGRLAVSSFGSTRSLTSWLMDRAKGLGARPMKIHTLESADELKKHLEAADFKQIQISEESKVFWYESFEDWWKSLWSHGLRSDMNQLSAEKLELLKKEALSMVSSPKISIENRAIFALAVKK